MVWTLVADVAKSLQAMLSRERGINLSQKHMVCWVVVKRADCEDCISAVFELDNHEVVVQDLPVSEDDGVLLSVHPPLYDCVTERN